MKNVFFILIMTCVLSKLNTQICVGDPGKVQWECWNGLYAAEFSELSALEFYPQRPDITQTLYSLSAPPNYDNYMGCRMSGFIHLPVTDSVIFNITGNRRARFLLSTTTSPNNLVMRASVPDWTNENEYTKYPEQTSVKIKLLANEYYYFELEYVEDSGSDHCRLYWKNIITSNTTWNIITAAYINDVGCKPALCPNRGTPCDDNNPNTTGETEDGHCHCVGKPVTSNTCVGIRSLIQSYRYNDIAGSTLNDLYASANFPAIPNTSSVLPWLGTKSESQVSNVGDMVQGYLTVPVTGNYKFNVTGDDMAILFLSSDHNPDNKQAHQMLVSGWTYMTEHNKYIYQSTSNIYLEAGQFYYFELNHKEGTGSEHFGAFWQTPFSPPGVWKRIPSYYLYDYGCDIACIPQGTICDDGNPFTNNDQYNGSCECAGTPCSGPDCDSPLANYIPFEKCGLTDQLDNNPANNWLSCQVINNPNPARNRSHWIMYDLGVRHQLISAHIWNYNVLNQVGNGFQGVSVDYSTDGVSWVGVGQYNWPLATGESGYGGFNGPDLSGIFARYLLITSMDDTTTCRGLGKVAFKAVVCPPDGTPCDDQNPLTINDVYNSCNCVGQNFLKNECNDTNLALGNVMLYTDVFSAVQYVNAVSTISENNKVSFIGGKSIILEPGFKTQPNAIFLASIDTCETNAVSEMARTSNQSDIMKLQEEFDLMLISVPNTDMVDIHFNVKSPGKVVLKLTGINELYTLVDNEYQSKGFYRKRIRTKKLIDATYLVTLQTSESVISEKLSIELNKVLK